MNIAATILKLGTALLGGGSGSRVPGARFAGTFWLEGAMTIQIKY
jgi:hypothetical protein